MPKKSFQRLFDLFNDELREQTSSQLRDQGETVAELFYSTMLTDTEATVFLDNDLVHKRLKSSFVTWVDTIFAPADKQSADELERLHIQIGTVHARIGIPMHLIAYGMQTVRDHLLDRIIGEGISPNTNSMVHYVNNLLDACLAVMNRSYFDETLTEERNAQMLRFKVAHADLTLECERMRSELIIWSRDIGLDYTSNAGRLEEKRKAIYSTPFGMWVNHKAELYFPDYEELKKIRAILVKIDTHMESSDSEQTSLERADFLRHLNEHVNQIGWFIDQIIEKSINEYQSKDSLTRLINRRFVDSVMKKEMDACRVRGETFGAIMIDIDDFKSVNDLYGHSFGDTVLQEIAGIILESVRITDFCFRYGGEEILVVTTNTDAHSVHARAESIRRAIESRLFSPPLGGAVKVTASMGVAVYEGHPDFKLVIDRADQNMYQAKAAGKNQVVS